jgi:hypothetical protein
MAKLITILIEDDEDAELFVECIRENIFLADISGADLEVVNVDDA